MNQIVNFGLDSANSLKIFLNEKKPRSIFLVTGKKSFTESGAEAKLFPILKNYNFTTFDDFEKNPKIEDVEKGVDIFNDNHCDFILAVGGGSAIDMAKLVLFFNKKSKPFTEFVKSNLNTQDKYPFGVLPTTAGSGSEATHFAVVYIKNIKFSIADINLLPEIVLIDHSFLKSQSRNQIIFSGIDAFCQGIESFWSVNSNEESLIYSNKAIYYSWNNLLKAASGEDVFENLAKASYFAGKAINITKTTGPHALSYSFTTNFNIPHGQAVSLFLPFFISFHKNITDENCNDERGSDFVRNQMNKISKLLCVDYNKLEFEIINFFKLLDLEINFQKLGISNQDFNLTVAKVNKERLKNNPRILFKKDLNDLYNFNLRQ